MAMDSRAATPIDGAVQADIRGVSFQIRAIVTVALMPLTTGMAFALARVVSNHQQLIFIAVGYALTPVAAFWTGRRMEAERPWLTSLLITGLSCWITAGAYAAQSAFPPACVPSDAAFGCFADTAEVTMFLLNVFLWQLLLAGACAVAMILGRKTAPARPHGWGPATVRPNHPLSNAALVSGLVGLGAFFIPIGNLVFPALALALGMATRRRGPLRQNLQSQAALWLGGAGLVLAILVNVSLWM